LLETMIQRPSFSFLRPCGTAAELPGHV